MVRQVRACSIRSTNENLKQSIIETFFMCFHRFPFGVNQLRDDNVQENMKMQTNKWVHEVLTVLCTEDDIQMLAVKNSFLMKVNFPDQFSNVMDSYKSSLRGVCFTQLGIDNSNNDDEHNTLSVSSGIKVMQYIHITRK